jgi:MFS family permease
MADSSVAASGQVSTASPDAAIKDPHVSADGHRPTKAEIWRLGIGFTFSAVICAIPWVALSTLVLPAVLQNINPDSKEAMLGMINAVGSVVALLANFVFGAISDNTRSRFGRRTPWIVAGGLLTGLSIGAIALFQKNIAMITILWCLGQLGYNMMLAPFVACMSDRVPDANRGTISAFYGAGITAGQTLGSYVGSSFVAQANAGKPGLTYGWILGLVVFGLIGIVTVIIWPREQSSKNMNAGKKLTARQIGQSFVPPTGKGVGDFYYALFGRTLMMAGYWMINTYTLYIASDYIFAGQPHAQKQGAALIATMSVIQLVVALIAAFTAGPITDRIHMRKTPVALAACLFAVGILMPLIIRRPLGMYLFALIAGFGYGVYNAIDQALNVDVLPNPDQAGKDLGILNVANTLSTVLGSLLTSAIVSGFKGAMHTGASTPIQAYITVFIVAIVLVLLAAFLIMRIKRIK